MEKTLEKKLTQVRAGMTNDKVVINSNLIGRLEAFRMLALAEATSLPLLFIGEPGVAKTAVVREYAGARVEQGSKLFILETDQYTRSSELKGRPNMAALVDKENPRYEVIAPIVDADYIVINEIDKASGGLRHALMSIMNERVIMTGDVEVPLIYKSFIGTCNEIPREEKGSPLWDRFILKMKLDRLSTDQLVEYMRKGHKNFRDSVEVKVPTRNDLSQGRGVPESKMIQLIRIIYDVCSDRTISFLPIIVKSVAHIWECNIDSALIKTCEILAGTAKGKQLSDLIASKEVKNVMDKVDMIHGLSDINTLKNTVHEIHVMVTNYAKEGKLSREQISEIEELLNNSLEAKGVKIEDIKK